MFPLYPLTEKAVLADRAISLSEGRHCVSKQLDSLVSQQLSQCVQSQSLTALCLKNLSVNKKQERRDKLYSVLHMIRCTVNCSSIYVHKNPSYTTFSLLSGPVPWNAATQRPDKQEQILLWSIMPTLSGLKSWPSSCFLPEMIKTVHDLIVMFSH